MIRVPDVVQMVFHLLSSVATYDYHYLHPLLLGFLYLYL